MLPLTVESNAIVYGDGHSTSEGIMTALEIAAAIVGVSLLTAYLAMGHIAELAFVIYAGLFA